MSSGIRTFTMYRQGDLSETHDVNQAPLGPDVPAFWGVEFPDGTCVLRWNGLAVSTSVWDSVETALKVHGHLDNPRYAAMLVWDDDDDAFNLMYNDLRDKAHTMFTTWTPPSAS